MRFKGKRISPYIVIEGLIWSIIISIIIRLLPLKAVFKIITPEVQKNRYEKEIIINSINLVLSLQKYIVPARCWKKSMLLFRFLKKNRYAPVMHFGVHLHNPNKDNRILEGHSWITIDNMMLFENDYKLSSTMTEILTYPN